MAAAPKLFSPMVLGRVRMRNRLVMESLGQAEGDLDGLLTPDMRAYYAARARAGAGAVVIGPVRATPPDEVYPHLGLYDDAHVSALNDCIALLRREGTAALVMLDQQDSDGAPDMAALVDAFALAAWRARGADADGVMLSTADGGPFRRPAEGARGEQRIGVLLQVIEQIVGLTGRRFVIGVRLGIEEAIPGGLSLQDARVIARRLAGSGANLLEVAVRVGSSGLFAEFPGWCVPVAAAIRAVVEVPVMVGGQLDDALLAEMAIADGDADLVAVGERLHREPSWPALARAELEGGGGAASPAAPPLW